jgi:hypothetical protein
MVHHEKWVLPPCAIQVAAMDGPGLRLGRGCLVAHLFPPSVAEGTLAWI